ncbi:hypothetical protein P153DRAFT_348195 [Dothidotthia symphoricarpi CBS 119687]|uniref:DUF1793-domain-containing protein n=1 Tax=Dothidotthia symphoricarpi CBS 119687 TaxID=1392245 RepID=A0A6A6A266_9PLEO|nr:uncharacterized protein P153DRAFT_348195 [Dothidotthia symphoricarpi CBS 119687]KAF2125939.1 hypothetical protein P153DRAFT_348195 [Dothidotthia symphoricarpi CBS 119687]
MKTSLLLPVVLAAHAAASAIRGRENVLTPEAQSLFDYSMQIQDNRFDKYYNYIEYVDRGSWSVRFTAWYTAGLLHRNEGDDVEHAKAAIENILACQLTSDFDAPWYGTWKVSADEPDPTPNSTLYPPEIYKTYDPNWREFIGTQLIQVVEEFSHLLPSPLISRIEDALETAAVGSMRRNGTFPQDDNLTLGYSNPGIMRALLTGWIGARRNNATYTTFATDQGTKLLQLFQLNGANTLSEYNAPTYYGVDTWALGAQLKYGPQNSTMTASAKLILTELWTDLAAHFNPYLGNMVGPYDRAYTRDMTSQSSILSMFFWGLFGHAHGPQPPKSEIALLYDIAQGAAISLLISTIRPFIPADVQDTLKSHTPTFTSRSLTKIINDDLNATHTRTATSWLSPALMIGAQSVNETVNRGDQFVPAIAHWAGDPKHTPYPLNTFLSLYPSASSIHAVASPNRLSMSYPNSTQEGTDVFTFLLSNVPPAWTAGGKTVTGLGGEMPCVAIAVEAPGLVELPVVYGGAIHGHVFWNVTFAVPGGFEGVPRVELGIEYTC